MMQADKNAGLLRESALLEGKCQLKAALSSALESKAEVEAALQTARLDQQRLQQEVSASQSLPDHALSNCQCPARQLHQPSESLLLLLTDMLLNVSRL